MLVNGTATRCVFNTTALVLTMACLPPADPASQAATESDFFTTATAVNVTLVFAASEPAPAPVGLWLVSVIDPVCLLHRSLAAI